MKLEHSLTPHTQINSKWIKDLNVRADSIKLLEENKGKTLLDMNHSNIFLDPSPRVMERKAKINQWSLIKLKSFCIAKETINKQKDNLGNGRKYLQLMQLKRGPFPNTNRIKFKENPSSIAWADNHSASDFNTLLIAVHGGTASYRDFMWVCGTDTGTKTSQNNITLALCSDNSYHISSSSY